MIKKKQNSSHLINNKLFMPLLILNLIFVIISTYFYLKKFQLIFTLIPIFFLLICDCSYFLLLPKINKDKLKEMNTEAELVDLFLILIIYLKSSLTLKSAIEKLLSVASNKIENKIRKLIDNINNSSGLSSYLSICEDLKNQLWKEVFFALYILNLEDDKTSYIESITVLINKIKDNLKDEKEDKYLNACTLFPYFATLLFFITIFAKIINVIGGYFNV